MIRNEADIELNSDLNQFELFVISNQFRVLTTEERKVFESLKTKIESSLELVPILNTMNKMLEERTKMLEQKVERLQIEIRDLHESMDWDSEVYDLIKERNELKKEIDRLNGFELVSTGAYKTLKEREKELGVLKRNITEYIENYYDGTHNPLSVKTELKKILERN